MGRKKNKNKSKTTSSASVDEKSTLEGKLQRRPDPKSLENKNIIPDVKKASSIQGNASRLKKRMSSHLVEEQLAHRHAPAELAAQGVVDPTKSTVSFALAPKIASLEKVTKANHVKNLLESRPSHHQLETMGVEPHAQTAPALRAAQMKLEKRLATDAVKVLLDTRPELDELRESGVVPDLETVVPVADRLQGPVFELEHKMKKDAVAQRLASRPQKKELSGGVLAEDAVAPVIQPARNALKQKLKASALKKSLLDDTPEVAEATTTTTTGRRQRMAIALKAASRLYQTGTININVRGDLKDLILTEHPRVSEIVDVFELDHDVDAMLGDLVELVYTQ